MRFNASAIAMLPSLVAGTLLKAPLKLPIGVRTALTITLCCMLIFSPGVLTFCSLQLSLRWECCPPSGHPLSHVLSAGCKTLFTRHRAAFILPMVRAHKAGAHIFPSDHVCCS